MFPNKFVIEWNGKAVGVDMASGGYPYKTDLPSDARYWDSREEAEDYMKHWPENIWFVHEIQFRIVG